MVYVNSNMAKVWLLLDDRAGNRNQCLGVASALSMPYDVKELRYSAWAKLPNIFTTRLMFGIRRQSRHQLVPPWPDLIITAGRRAGAIARALKERSGGKSKLIQIMWPGSIGAADFDLMCIPNHDDVPDLANIFRIPGSPNLITPNGSDTEPVTAAFDELPSPRIALLCGGTNKHRRFTKEMAAALGRRAAEMANQSHGSLLILTSRRSGDAAESLINEINSPCRVHRWQDPGANPYRTYLAAADAIIVTGDSMSMCSEACSTGKPVYIYAPAKLVSEKHVRLHEELYQKGCARPLKGNFEKWTYVPLNTAAMIAQRIRCQFELK